ncbi:1-deoxy-D-xylulose-5-phosphate reductoisomerase [Vannielia litorea]|uniref:1-deoxy-D-xylulose 5-phosphate reductoisomerase n=1 Tax=Vannielia litorea TaxID=1217970 RepID=A0A1N6F6I6_9RHOB|nr:1-deoxy-D-xylulose-5-phosphate reductoisomerase [Vannielia litorea]SIN90816.1 1-deoxy-D-xylulose 5-phosphate reductoisomerase [Vannielia litorea]
MKRVTLLGSTGSIGESALDLIGRGGFRVEAVTGGRNLARLAEQAVETGAALAVTCFSECYEELAARLEGTDVEVAAGPDAVAQAAGRPADLVLNGIVGAAGLQPSLAALTAGSTLALANKESLVCAGPLVMATAARHGGRVLPVDSEHSAVFQALVGEDIGAVERVVITASGGAFRDWPLEEIARATPEQAATHPNWDMGQRITIDSASMFNKALEVIEAHEFFGLAPEQIEVLVHPQSAVHALVGFVDGAMMAHLGAPDMRHAIGYALNWPERAALPVDRLDLAALGRLDFATPDPARYPALGLAWEVMRAGGLMGAVFNAAKEAALDGFLDRRIGFADMARIVERVMGRMASQTGLNNDMMSLDNVLQADQMARQLAREAMAEAKEATG